MSPLSPRQSDRPTWEHESCLECRLRMPSDHAAEAHYNMTGHALGWPFDEDELSWPVGGNAQIMGQRR